MELPEIPESERIYFNIPYQAKGLANELHCEYDGDKKLWFTGLKNTHLHMLVKKFGVNEATSETAKLLLDEKLEE